MLIQENMDIQEKLKILSDAAKYDVSCSSSGIARKGKKGMIGNTLAAGICHSFAADGRCISLLKILFTNQCIYDCRPVKTCTSCREHTPTHGCDSHFYLQRYAEKQKTRHPLVQCLVGRRVPPAISSLAAL